MNLSTNFNDLQSPQLSYNNMEDFDIDPQEEKWSKKNYIYYTKDVKIQAKNQQDVTILIGDILKKAIAKTVQIVQDKEMDKKTPNQAVIDTLLCCERVILPYAGVFDDSETDFITNGLQEDLEPSSSIPDAWIRSKIQVDQQNIELYDQMGSLQDLQSSKKFADTRSVYSTVSKYSTYSKATSNKSAVKKRKKQQNPPIPIDLSEPLFITEEEEQLRKEKEEEKRKIQRQLQKIRDEQLRQEEEAKNKQKEQKQDKNVIGSTYDYSGKEIFVHRLKVNQLPPTNISMQLDLIDPQQEALKLQKKNKRNTIKKIQKSNINDSYNNSLYSTSKQKMTGSQTGSTLPPIKLTEFTSNPMDTIQLNEGVVVIYDGRKRIGPKPNSQALMYLTGTLSSQNSKLRLNKKDYDKIVLGQDKLGSHKLNNNEKNQRLLKTLQEQNANESVDFKQDQYYNTFSNFKQGNKNQTGEGIQVHKTNIIQQLTFQIEEEDENLMRMQKIQKEKLKQHLDKLQEQSKQSVIDRFNQTQIVGNSQWGKQHQDAHRSYINTPFSLSKPNQKNLQSTLGKVNKPRSRADNKGEKDHFTLNSNKSNIYNYGTFKNEQTMQNSQMYNTKQMQSQHQTQQQYNSLK